MSTVLESLKFLMSSAEFVEIKNGAGYRIDLRYNSANNFVGHDMYGPFNRAFLHKIAAEKLELALRRLQQEHPRYKFIVYDALRPRSVQRILWSHVVGTEGEKYIANPDLGSLHNFGFAVDLSVLDENDRELDMGAGYDDFRPVAQPQLEEKFLADGTLTRRQVDNRLILRKAMAAAGFAQLPHEWWHYDAMEKSTVRNQFRIVE